jgi:hypothetical protein
VETLDSWLTVVAGSGLTTVGWWLYRCYRLRVQERMHARELQAGLEAARLGAIATFRPEGSTVIPPSLPAQVMRDASFQQPVDPLTLPRPRRRSRRRATRSRGGRRRRRRGRPGGGGALRRPGGALPAEERGGLLAGASASVQGQRPAEPGCWGWAVAGRWRAAAGRARPPGCPATPAPAEPRAAAGPADRRRRRPGPRRGGGADEASAARDQDHGGAGGGRTRRHQRLR